MALSDSVYLGVTTVLLVVSLIGIALVYPAPGETPVNATADYRSDLSGVRYTVPQDALWTLCLGTDCVPSVDRPDYTSAADADAWLERGDPVVGVTRGSRAYAFPVRILRYHGVVNTHIAGEPVAVTYSPHSGVHRVYSRVVDGRVLTFHHDGTLYNGNMVMRDRETGTLWSQFTGEAIRGPSVPATLDPERSHVARWSLWQLTHPDTAVLDRPSLLNASRYVDDPYATYRRTDRTPVGGWDDALHPKDLVYGIESGGDAVAYRDVHVRDLELVQDEVGDTPVMLVQDEQRGTITAFRRTVDGTPVDFMLRNGSLVDTATGSRWTLDGEAVEGPLAGTTLVRMDAVRSYWYTWNLFHPDTDIYRP